MRTASRSSNSRRTPRTHKTPGKTSVSTAARRLALMDRAVSEDCQAASAALLHSVNHLPSMTRFARLIPLPRAARYKSPPGCLLIAHEVWRLKPLSLRSKVIRLQLAMPLSPHRGRMIAFATAVRSGPPALRGFPFSLDFTYFTHCKETLQFFLFKKCVTCIK